jgi:hypothetical protein
VRGIILTEQIRQLDDIGLLSATLRLWKGAEAFHINKGIGLRLARAIQKTAPLAMQPTPKAMPVSFRMSFTPRAQIARGLPVRYYVL